MVAQGRPKKPAAGAAVLLGHALGGGAFGPRLPPYGRNVRFAASLPCM